MLTFIIPLTNRKIQLNTAESYFFSETTYWCFCEVFAAFHYSLYPNGILI